MADTANLLMPIMEAGQSQKHVTHNEAIQELDALVQMSVKDRNLSTPPGSPVEGDRYIIGAAPTGAWTGAVNRIAAFQGGVWNIYIHREGWACWVDDEDVIVAWNGTAWIPVSGVTNFADDVFGIIDNLDPTKIARFQISGLTTGITRTFTLPDVTSTIAVLAATQTFTGTTTFSGTFAASGGTTSLGTGTGTTTANVGTGATLTATTKTVNIGTAGVSGSTTGINIGSAVAGALGTLVINSPTVTFASSVSVIAMTSANMSALYLGLGGATADATNRLSINTPAVLFNNAGTNINATLNKNAAANDATLTFQTNFSTRAIFGTTGTDDFVVKVSPDGSAFNDGLLINRTTAQATGRRAGTMAAVQWAKQTADAARANVATAQAIFDAAFDTLTLEAATTYEMEAEYSISRAAGTVSHTTGILFGGTATYTSFDYLAQVTNPTGNVLAAVQQIWGTAATLLTITAANIIATENIIVKLKGTVRCLAAGTFIPQFQYSAAPGGVPTVRRNSTIRMWPVGINTLGSAGANWA